MGQHAWSPIQERVVMHQLESLLHSKQEGLRVLQQQLQLKQSALAQHENRYTEILGSIELDKKAVEVVKLITEHLSANGIQRIQDMVTRGLQAIFTDDSYQFKIEVMERGTSKTVEFFVVDSKGNKSPLDKCGGGIIVMSSFLLRVFLVIKLKLLRLIVLDEAFIQVSAEYTEGLMAFMHTLVDEAQFRFLWVTHSQNYIDGADHIFKINHGALTRVDHYRAH